MLNAENFDRVLDRGPEATDKQKAPLFRKLWGEKAELRRFKDGSILECVSWPQPPTNVLVESHKRPAVLTSLVRHLLRRHFPSMFEDMKMVSGPVGFVNNLGEHGRRLWVAFDALRTHLCHLSSMPLTVKEVHPEDAAFSYTEIRRSDAPAAPDGVARSLHSLVLEFVSSGNWPDDAEAVLKVSNALLIQMGDELQKDLGIDTNIGDGFLDVRFPEFVFRLRIFNRKEFLEIASNVVNFDAMPDIKSLNEHTLQRFRDVWWRSRLRVSLRSLTMQTPNLAGAIRLFKRWMATQMLSGYDEFVEHIVASVFVRPIPFDIPNSPHVGFCRALWLLSAFDWRNQPLIVDFDGECTPEERLSMRRSFERDASRAGGDVTVWICSRIDPHGLLLTTPPATMFTWLQGRARSALDFCKLRVLGLTPGSSWTNLFALSRATFDVMICLIPRKEMSAKDTRKKRKLAAVEEQAVLEYVSALRTKLSPVCLVLSDTEKREVALKWRPNAFLPQRQTVLTKCVQHTLVAQGKGDQPVCVPNVMYLMSVIGSLGSGIITDLKLLDNPALSGHSN